MKRKEKKNRLNNNMYQLYMHCPSKVDLHTLQNDSREYSICRDFSVVQHYSTTQMNIRNRLFIYFTAYACFTHVESKNVTIITINTINC